ncbi:CDP-alcohol phosphatidyltransferase family protein [Agreia sp. COWG]|uniref:CDP-alcohol phosphatidyltransferase family protein n=1 Tax=Agreia sp. COWG TaxID=2773266 RepID=UPI001929496D|nr:CDP-alcohol phosphatidyltransferase family protein [Agreia sp. COWG]
MGTVRRLASAQKKAARGAPPYSVYVNRKVGRFFAAWAYRAGLSPNAVTGISAAFTFTAIALIATVQPAWWLGIVVFLLLAVGYAFDSADGQVARLRGGGSASGEWLDHVVDALKISTLHLAVLISAYRFFDLTSEAMLLIPIGYSVVAAVSFFAMILNDQLKAAHGVGTAASGTEVGGRSWVRSLFLVPTDYGFLCMLFVLLGFPVLFLVAYSLFFVANAAHLALASVKWFRDMSRLG